ncbi:MAG: hypothetical protein ACPIOQ_02705 [Promethearchaeia archaeon]
MLQHAVAGHQSWRQIVSCNEVHAKSRVGHFPLAGGSVGATCQRLDFHRPQAPSAAQSRDGGGAGTHGRREHIARQRRGSIARIERDAALADRRDLIQGPPPHAEPDRFV